MLWELVFLSITVLRPHLANDLTAEPNRIDSFGGAGGASRAFALGAELVLLNMSVCVARVSVPEAPAFFVQRGALASYRLLRGRPALVPPEFTHH